MKFDSDSIKGKLLLDAVLASVEREGFVSARATSRAIGRARLHVEAAVELLILRGWIVAKSGSLSIAPADSRTPISYGDIRALSAECSPNPLVSKWYRTVGAGSPGLGARHG